MKRPTVLVSDLPEFVAHRAEGLHLYGDVRVDGHSVPFCLVTKPSSKRLAVFYNGAVNRSMKPDGVVFQRLSWVEDFDCSSLFLADPTILGVPSMALGWGQMSGRSHFAPIAARVAEAFALALEVPHGPRVLHVGSSAGGFQAMAAAAFHSRGAALVNNAQFDWTRYEMQDAVDRLLAHLGYGDRGELLDKEPWRVSIPSLIRHYGLTLRVRYLLNSESKLDLARQFPIFQELVGIPGVDTEVVEYEDAAAGHDPLPRAGWTAQLRRFLDDTA